MISAIGTFFCGILLLQWLPILPDVYLIIAICFLGIVVAIWWLCFASKYNKNKKIRFCLMRLVLFLLGFLYALVAAKWFGHWELPADLSQKNIIVSGYVSSLPVNKSEYSKFHFSTETIAGTRQQTTILLSWYGKDRQNVAAGEKWQLHVKLKPPHGMLNPGGFDYEKYLWQQHLRATGYVLNSEDNKKLSLHFSAILVWRQNIASKINSVLLQQPLASMINALVLGDQSNITKEQWSIFRATGTNYLMVIAGLHICLAASIIFVLVEFLWRYSLYLSLWLPARKAAALSGFVAALIYSVLSGWSIPTQRALIMLAMFTLTVLWQRHINVWQVLFISLLAVLLLDPMSVLAIGFWLSFIAVALIFYVTAGRLQLKNIYWRKYVRMQGAITLGLAPFTLLFFAQASLATFIANIFALPGVCLLVVPLSLVGSLLLPLWFNLGKYILLLAEKVMELVWYGLQWLALYHEFNWQHAVFTWWQLALAIVGLFLLLAPRGVCGKCVGIIWFCPLLFCLPPQPGYGEIWFSMLDVGEGLATVIQTQHHVVLYDTGPKFSDSDVGESIVVPFLQSVGITHVDTMVVSHGDDDHSGGAMSILQLLSVNKIITSIPEKFTPHLAERCYAGQAWQWDGVDFHMLYPPISEAYDGNKTSCVLRVTNGKNSILLPGDIEHGQEKDLLRFYDKNLLASTILVAPHHGSATSSTPDFIDAVKAQYALFSVGFANRFHFPKVEILARYQQQGTKILQTKDTGAISFKLILTQDVLQPVLYRDVVRHYWNY